MPFFVINKERRIDAAVEVTYRNPSVHPSRNNPGFHDMVYCISGVWDFVCEGTYYEVIPGDVFILPGNCEYIGKSPCTAGTTNIFIHFNMLPEDGKEKSESAMVIPMDTVIHCGNEPLIKNLFEEIHSVFSSDTEYRNKMLSILLNALLCALYNNTKKTIVHDRDIAEECIEIMKKDLSKLYKESEMADLLYVSVKTLRNGFKKRFNKTFCKFQLDWKLEQAYLYLLNNPNTKIYQIAYDLGFCNEFHMSKVFKEKYGISPTECKKKIL